MKLKEKFCTELDIGFRMKESDPANIDHCALHSDNL